MNRLYIIAIIILLTACSNWNGNERVVFQESDIDNRIERSIFYENGGLKSKHTLSKDSTEYGPYELYYINGNLKERGTIVDGEKFGYTYYYRKDGSKKMFEDYTYGLTTDFNVQLNQVIVYDSNENVIDEKSNYFDILHHDTINLGTQYEAKISLLSPEHSKMLVKIGVYKDRYPKKGSGIPSEFIGNDNVVNISFNDFKDQGVYYVHGFVYDYKDTIVNGDSATYGKEMYFHYPIFVK